MAAPTVATIQARVARFYGIEMEDMRSPSRVRRITRPRQVGMFLSRRLTSRSLNEIGLLFGNRDHTTILHGIRSVETRARDDRELARDIGHLIASIQPGLAGQVRL